MDRQKLMRIFIQYSLPVKTVSQNAKEAIVVLLELHICATVLSGEYHRQQMQE